MTEWNIRYASVGGSGIDYKKISPFCIESKSYCPSCKHLDQVEAKNKDKDGKVIDKDHAKTIKTVRGIHKGDINTMLPKAANKEGNNA